MQQLPTGSLATKPLHSEKKMEITELINHPERMDRDTLYDLRSTVALYPYFQTARLLMLQNMYLLHHPDFDAELRRTAIYVSDRRTLFQMIEAAHYVLRKTLTNGKQQTARTPTAENRTIALIENFLDKIPEEAAETNKAERKPTPADATVDYVTYLMETETAASKTDIPQMRGQSLIDDFLAKEPGRMVLSQEQPSSLQSADAEAGTDEPVEEEFFTETLARIYIRQGRYQKAMDIIGRLAERYPKKNAYFSDQMRFLEKLIINNTN